MRARRQRLALLEALLDLESVRNAQKRANRAQSLRLFARIWTDTLGLEDAAQFRVAQALERNDTGGLARELRTLAKALYDDALVAADVIERTKGDTS